MSNAIVALANITNRVLETYHTNEGRVVKKMKSKYANRIVAIMPIIFQEDKVQYFNNKFVNWVVIMYYQLVKELITWDKCQKNMIKGTTKREPKKDVCHFAIVLQVLFQKWCSLEGAKSQEKKKQVEQLQKDKRRRDSMREMFIKNKRPLNPTHISPKNEKLC